VGAGSEDLNILRQEDYKKIIFTISYLYTQIWSVDLPRYESVRVEILVICGIEYLNLCMLFRRED